MNSRVIPSILVCSSLFISSAKAVPRKVLAENFTATWCTPYCPQVAEGMILLLEEFPDSFIGMQVHGADAYSTPWGDSRYSFYNLTGFPGVWIDGSISLLGSLGTPEANYAQLRGLYMERQNVTTDVKLEICGSALNTDSYAIDVLVEIEASGESKPMQIYCAQVIHNYPSTESYNYACFMQETMQEVVVDAGTSQSLSFQFTLNSTSLTRVEDVSFVIWAQSVNGTSPSEVYQAERHAYIQDDSVIDLYVVGPFGHFATINEAVNACGTGDTILVTPGTYLENIDLSGRQITIESTNGPEVTVLDGNAQGTVVRIGCIPNASTILRGFTIQNGFASNGGGIYTDGSPTINNCVVRSNTAKLGGGLFHLQNGTAGPHVSSTRFCENTYTDISGNWINGGENTFSTNCDAQCIAEINTDGIVNVVDLLAVVCSWGVCVNCLEDLNESGVVDVTDLLFVIDAWGSCS